MTGNGGSQTLGDDRGMVNMIVLPTVTLLGRTNTKRGIRLWYHDFCLLCTSDMIFMTGSPMRQATQCLCWPPAAPPGMPS